MRYLIVEDDFANRHIMRQLMAEHGGCDIAVNGVEAIDAFGLALSHKRRYELVLLDIMMPEMDGLEALQRIRAMEAEAGISVADGVKVIMTTALSDLQNIISAFEKQCEAYIVKPVTKEKLDAELRKLGLMP